MTFQRCLHQVALVAAVLGATIGVAASYYAWFTRGDISTATICGSCFALTAALPVLRDYFAIPTNE